MSRVPSQQLPTIDDNQQQISNELISKIKADYQKTLLLIIITLLLVSTFAVYYYFSTIELVQQGLFYREKIMSKEMFPFWKELKDDEESKNSTHIIEEGAHQISRKQLGNMGWTILHMVTGSFPGQIPDELVKKWNTFLVLFAQFYPCKICSGHFLQLLQQTESFKGNKKEQLMIYLCELHNKVNKKLGHPHHNCSQVKDQWNTCGCKE